MRLGVHIPIAGGILEAVPRAARLSCTTMQIFSRSPRGGPAPVLSEATAAQFNRDRQQARISPLAIHAPYIMNLASPDAFMWKRSVALLREEYARATLLRADYLVVHLGSHRGAGVAVGVQRVTDAMHQTLEGTPSKVTVLLEHTAGSGQGLGSRFEEGKTMAKM